MWATYLRAKRKRYNVRQVWIYPLDITNGIVADVSWKVCTQATNRIYIHSRDY